MSSPGLDEKFGKIGADLEKSLTAKVAKLDERSAAGAASLDETVKRELGE